MQTPGILWSAEARLLALCARTVLGEEQRQAIRELIATERVDWDLACELSLQHYVSPLFWRSSREAAADLVPADKMWDLQQAVTAGVHRNLLLTGELIRAVKLLDANNIPVICFKGPALTLAVYKDLSLRPFGDLDLLVPERHVRRAAELIAGIGYVPEHVKDVDRFEKPFTLVNQTAGARIELHHRLIPRRLSLALESTIWERAGEFVIGGYAVRTLSVEDLLIYLCAHGAKHRWVRLQWICDIAELVRARPDLSWPKLHAIAQNLGAKRIVSLSFAVAEAALGLPAPAEVHDQSWSTPDLKAQAERIVANLFKEKGNLRYVDSRLFELMTRERLRDRLRILFRTAVSRYRFNTGRVQHPVRKVLGLLRGTLSPIGVLVLTPYL